VTNVEATEIPVKIKVISWKSWRSVDRKSVSIKIYRFGNLRERTKQRKPNHLFIFDQISSFCLSSL